MSQGQNKGQEKTGRLNNIKLVVFDFDDTLCMTESGCFEMENEAAQKLGLPEMSREIHIRTWGLPFPEALPVRFPGVDVARFLETIKELIPAYVACGKVDCVPDKNLALLDQLKEAGFKLAVLTAREGFECGHLLEPGGRLSRRLDRFYHKGAYDSMKPDPRVFDVVLRDFGVAPKESLYVGDSPGDAASALGAGLCFIACLESGVRDLSAFNGHAIDGHVFKLEALSPRNPGSPFWHNKGLRPRLSGAKNSRS